MLSSITNFVVRRDDTPAMDQSMVTLIVVLLVLLIVALLLLSGLLFLRARRRARKQEILPAYDEKRLSTSTTSSAHRRVMIRPSESIYVYQEKQNLIDNSNSPPQSPLPEIHITFPEEVDAAGKRKSGRVVVVHVGDTGVGLEPADGLPPYEQTEGERFQSIDLERVGGLVEKARNAPSKEYE